MIGKFEMRGVHIKLDDNIRKYVTRKIGHIDKYLPRKSRACAHAEVHLKEAKTSKSNQCTCEVTMHLPHETIVVRESTLNMYAAVDIVETKLKQQLRKYKELHYSNSTRRRLFARFGRGVA